MEMLGLTNFEVKCCKILNDAEQPKIVSTKWWQIGWLKK
jgi:hypothetical protein